MQDEVLMSQSAILQLETIENAFIVGLLLTGSIEQAERAIVDSIHCSETEYVCGQRVFRRVIQWAVDPQEQRRLSLDVFSICRPACVTVTYYEFSSGYRGRFARGSCTWMLSRSATALSLR
jgi:hypothetical protein